MNYLTGDIWTSERDVLAIPVNCVGVPGKGLALQWARRYPTEARLYKAMCARGGFRPGGIDWYDHTMLVATKDDWRNPSRPEWIEIGLLRLALFMERTNKSMAIPMLGCGLGGLDWHKHVRPLVGDILLGYNVDVYEES